MTVTTLYNRVKMTVSGTPGTGVITLGSAVSGYQSFAGAGVPNSTLVSYAIEDTGGAWEVGQGTYATSGTTLTRTTVVASSNSGSAINATSAAIVYIAALAADLNSDTAATANKLAMRDANGNLTTNNFIEGYTTTATAGGTTTLTVSSTYQQYFTGTSAQTVQMPVASTLVLGQTWLIDNNSTGAVTIQSSGGNTIATLPAGASAAVTCILTSGTSAASWNAILTPPPNQSYWFWGDGSDGDVTISSGTTTLTRDMYYNNLTISGTGSLATAGWRVFVLRTLDLTGAPAGAISCNGATGNNGVAYTGGAAKTRAATNWDVGATSGAGCNGNAAGGASTTLTYMGGLGGTGGAATQAGGAANGTALVQRIVPLPVTYLTVAAVYGGGGSGGGGGGSGVNSGGGSGGTGAPPLYLYAATIARGGSTATAAIQAIGGTGGTAGSSANSGGGGGGGGGAIFIVCSRLTGSPATNAISAAGGPGGTGIGIGVGGKGGAGGCVMIANMAAGSISNTTGSAGSTSGSTTGGTAGTCAVTL